jgi:hypothetical protein
LQSRIVNAKRESVSKCSVVIRNSSIVREMAEIAKKFTFAAIMELLAAMMLKLEL